jgi:hypothetical protein
LDVYMHASTAIATIIQSCLDDERMLVEGSRRIDLERSGVLLRLASERRRFADALERFNGQASRESWKALAEELENDLWAEMAGPNAGDVVASCRRSQRRTKECYARALELPLPAEVRVVLLAQQAEVDAAEPALARIEY